MDIPPSGVMGLVKLAVEAVKLSGDVDPTEPVLLSSKLMPLVSIVRKLDDSDGHESECEKAPYPSKSGSPLLKKSMPASMQAPSKLFDSITEAASLNESCAKTVLANTGTGFGRGRG